VTPKGLLATGLLAAMALLAGCAEPTYPTAPASAAAPAATPSAPPPRSAAPAPTVVAKDCGAADLQSLIGRPRTEIPVPLDPNRQRVTCTTCPVAENVDPGRLNFLFDADSGRIKEIRCG
jgi:hypothetical protein